MECCPGKSIINDLDTPTISTVTSIPDSDSLESINSVSIYVMP